MNAFARFVAAGIESLTATSRRARIGCVLAGAVLPLSFAPFRFWPLAPLALGVFFVLLDACPPREAARRGWLFGVGLFGVGVSWVYESFQYNNIGPVVALPLTVAFVLFLALYPGLAAWAAARTGITRPGARLLLLLPALWSLGEWLRGWLLTGFTWLQLGYGQIDGPLAALAPIMGVHGVGVATALSGGVLAWAATRRDRVAVAGVVALSLGWLALLPARGIAWTSAAGAPLSALLVQGNVPQDQKWLPSMRQPTLDRYVRLTREAGYADIVVWPETALPDLLQRLRDFLAGLDEEARAAGADLLVGAPSIDLERRVYLNTVTVVGGASGVYHKRHLVPFGEFLPFDRWLRPLTDALGIPVANFAPGPAAQPLLRLAGYPVSVTICYEVTFGDEVARDLPAAALLVTVSNDAWFGDSIAPAQHLQIARMRALETGRWMLRATNTGISAFVSPDGRVTARTPQFEPATLTGEVVPMRGATPYVRFGDWPAVLLAAALAVAGWLAGRRRRDA